MQKEKFFFRKKVEKSNLKKKKLESNGRLKKNVGSDERDRLRMKGVRSYYEIISTKKPSFFRKEISAQINLTTFLTFKGNIPLNICSLVIVKKAG